MASCGSNIRTKNYQNLMIGFKVTVKNVVDIFRHSVFTDNKQSRCTVISRSFISISLFELEFVGF